MKIGRPPVAPEMRFFRRVEQSEDCWVWTGGSNAAGYGYFSEPSRRIYAHRWSYEFFVGSIPEGLQLDHLCRRPSCVNPWHLEPVTPRVNTRRGVSVAAVNAAKTHCKHGHEFTPDNTIVVPLGRECRVCRLETYKRYRQRKKAAA